MLSNIEYAISSSEDIFDILKESVEDYFLKDVYQTTDFDCALDKRLDALKDDLYFLIEYPYVDKVYRNSYYSYYASKHSVYQRDCIRVSIYSEEITTEDFLIAENHQKLQEKFLGYFILRPIKAIFGRSLIHPDAFEENDFKICMEKSSCLIFGVKLEIIGFPHSSQDGETITCAETTIWAMMEYFGNRYAEYKPVLPSHIIKTLEYHASQRQLPSDGLTMDEISYVLKQFGFGTRLYSAQRYDEDLLFEIIDTYIESGIPLMVGLESKGGALGHVVVLIGKQYANIVFPGTSKNYMAFGRKVEYFDATDAPSRYVVQDDNLTPYRIVSLNEPGEHYEDGASKSYKIDTIVVPLYPKIYLEAYVAKRLIIQILQDDHLGFDFPDGFVLRFFLASSRSFKSHIANLSNIDLDLKKNMLIAKMPKFIWIAEIYLKGTFKYFDGEPSGLIALDATEANFTNSDTLIFAGYPDRFVSIEENKFVTLQHTLKNYSYYSNLM